MKSFFVIFVLIVSSECGLLDDLVSSKEESQGLKGLLNKKPQSATESKRKEYNQGVILKVRETLENGTKIIIDALGNVIRIHPKENSKTESPESTTNSSLKDNEVVKKDEASKPTDPVTDSPTNSTEKLEDAIPKTDNNQNKTLPTEQNAKTNGSETPAIVEDQNETLPTGTNAETKDGASNDKENVENTADTINKIDGNTGNNCTADNGKACAKVQNRTSFNGDECPAGKSRADDGTCVEEVK